MPLGVLDVLRRVVLGSNCSPLLDQFPLLPPGIPPLVPVSSCLGPSPKLPVSFSALPTVLCNTPIALRQTLLKVFQGSRIKAKLVSHQSHLVQYRRGLDSVGTEFLLSNLQSTLEES